MSLFDTAIRDYQSALSVNPRFAPAQERIDAMSAKRKR